MTILVSLVFCELQFSLEKNYRVFMEIDRNFTFFQLLGAIENHVEYLLDAKVLEFVRSKHFKG